MGASSRIHHQIPLDVLHSVFGYETFRGDQAAIVDAVVKGRSGLVVMPTGAGKSLCYQLPALLRPGVAVVVSPLIALMADQVAALTLLGVKAAAYNSMLNTDERAAVQADLRAGRLDLLYVAPERLMGEDTLRLLSEFPLALIAIDEAHCVSEWGHDFRPDYLALGRLAQRFPDVPRLALTATADAGTREVILNRLAIPAANQWLGGFDRPNIRYTVADKDKPLDQVVAFVRAQPHDAAGIIYCQSRARVDRVAEKLSSLGLRALPYHAGLEDSVRAHHQQKFLSDDGLIMVATIAFGMGINKPDIRYVLHMDLPKSVEAYYQETGRAGRDGAPAEAHLLYGPSDAIIQQRWIADSDADDVHKTANRARLDALISFCEAHDCRRNYLLGYFGDHRTHACGNCDICLAPPKLTDARVLAQKLLSAVHRVGQRFGVTHVIDVLAGRTTERVTQFGHDQLSVFGIGKDQSDKQWRALTRQLVAREQLAVDVEGYNALKLTGKSRAVLRGEVDVVLRVAPEKSRNMRRGAAQTLVTVSPEHEALFDALRAVRKELATEAKLPAYVILHDASLREMAVLKPKTMADMAHVKGMGSRKLEAYGAAFLAAIAG